MLEFIAYFFISLSIICSIIFCFLVLQEGWKEYKLNNGNKSFAISLLIVMLLTLSVSGGAYLFQQHEQNILLVSK